MTVEERRGILYVSMAVLLFSTSPVLVRWAAESLSAYEIAAGRLLTAAILILGLARMQRQSLPKGSEVPRFLLYGLIAALHFGLYIASLAYTTIAHSLALVYTAPIFVALFSWLGLGERLSRRGFVGIAISMIGLFILTGFEPALDQRMLFGDLLAIGSAVSFALYSVAGRRERFRHPLFAYAGSVYLSGALWLLPAAALNFSPDGYRLPALLSVLALGILPLGLGHTLYNGALRRIGATQVNLIATQEVTGGILLGVLLLGEIPGWVTLFGVAVTLLGIVLVVVGPSKHTKRKPG